MRTARFKIGRVVQGFSAFAEEDIDAGKFVCQYAGELISTGEARSRLLKYDADTEGPGHALLVGSSMCHSAPALHP